MAPIGELLVEKGLVTRDEILAKIGERRAIYQRMLNPTRLDLANRFRPFLIEAYS